LVIAFGRSRIGFELLLKPVGPRFRLAGDTCFKKHRMSVRATGTIHVRSKVGIGFFQATRTFLWTRMNVWRYIRWVFDSVAIVTP